MLSFMLFVIIDRRNDRMIFFASKYSSIYHMRRFFTLQINIVATTGIISENICHSCTFRVIRFIYDLRTPSYRVKL